MAVEQDDVWKLIELLFSNRRDLYRHQFENYDFFIEKIVPHEIKNINTIDEHEDPETNSIYSNRFVFSNISFKPAILENGTDYMTPMIARYRQLSYFGTVIADVKQIQERLDLVTGEQQFKVVTEEKAVPVAKLPIMVKSKYCTTTIIPEKAHEECAYDPGCYFIVNGSEKVVLSIERQAPNKIFVYEKRKDTEVDYRASVTSQSDNIEGTGLSYGYNVRLRMKAGGTILLTTNGLTDIPVSIVLRALGVTDDEQLVTMVTQRPVADDLEMVNHLRATLDDCVDDDGQPIRTADEAILFLSKKASGVRLYSQNPDVRAKQKQAYIKKMMTEDMLPHIVGTTMDKAAFICLMIRRILSVCLQRTKPDDRDTFTNKRIEMPGILLGQLFRQNWNKMIKECGMYFRKKNVSDDTPVKVINQIKPLVIEQSMKSALLTGRWGLSKTKHGVARVLERLSYVQSVAQFRRVITPTLDEKNSKISSMRHVHASQVGFLCVVETPEGEKIGLVKNLSMSATITTSDLSSGSTLRRVIKDHEQTLDPSTVPSIEQHKYFWVVINGDYTALTKDPRSIVDYITDMKLANRINRYTSICIDADLKEVRLFTDSGRLIRPLLRVDPDTLRVHLSGKQLSEIDITGVDTKKITNWETFLAKYPQVIEYVDVEQSPFSLISVYLSDLDNARKLKSLPPQSVEADRTNRYANMYTPYTYCELHPSLNLGMTVSTIPFCNMNQSPRNLFQYAQAKQAMGIYATNWANRFDISNVLYHPQVPLVTTRAMDFTGLMDLPNGENIIIAIAPYSGYNQEDSLVLNATSVARGLFRSSNLKKYSSTIEKNQVSSQDDIHTKPDRNLVSNLRADVNYEKLNSMGYIEEETVVDNGDAILGKVSPINPSEKSVKVFKDKSEVYKGFHSGVVDKVQTGIINGEGYEMYNMRIRSERVPQIGDKFCYTEDHEVLTTQGWIPIADITTSHKVACLVQGRRLEYQHPTETVRFNYEGNMYCVDTGRVSLCVTPNHKLWVSETAPDAVYGLRQAQQAHGLDLMYKSNCEEWNPGFSPFITEGHKFFVFPGGTVTVDLKAWCTLFGIFLSIGVLESDSISVPIQHKHVQEVLQACEELLKLRPTRETGLWRYTNTVVVRYLSKLEEARLPDWCFELPMTYSRAMVFGILCQESCREDLADDFMRLALHCGWSSTTRCTLYTAINQPLVTRDEACYKYFDGTVYCCSVPSHVMYVRRKGLPVWCGNSNRSGQKATCGILLPQEDMPFTEDGIVPDLIINPNCIPKRMTIGQLLEVVVSKTGALKGEFRDGTAFERRDMESVCSELEELGYDRYGYESVYSGISGRKMESRLFIGPCFYQRLKHLVADKIHARATGPTVMMTRQPPEGRTKNGGLRFGEMEMNAICAHGAAVFLKERFMECSDKYNVHICDTCGLMASKLKNHPGYFCKACDNTTDISLVQVPYAFKLLTQELMAINIVPRLRTSKTEYDDA